MGEEERFQEIKWLLNATIEEFDSFLKSAGGFEEVKVGNGWHPSEVPYFPYLFVPMPASKALELAEKRKVEIFRSVFWVISPKREKIKMVCEPKIEFMPIWEIEGYHECYFFRDGAYHLKVKEDVVAIEVEGKLRNLVTESSNERRGPGDLDEKTEGFMVQRPKHFTIDKVVELAYQSRKARLYLDQKGNEDKEFTILQESNAKVESLSERTDLDNLVKNYLKDAVENKKIAFEKLGDKIVKAPENFNKILTNRFEVSILNLYLVPFYVYRYRYQDKIKEISINGVTGELHEWVNSSSLQS